MDGNALIEVIKSGVPVLNSSISAIAGAIVTTLFLRKNTLTAEFEKIKVGKFSEVIDDLLDSGKMSYFEYYKCKNFLEIAQKADELHSDDGTIDSSHVDYDFDWFIRFFDYASNISNDEMQILWAHVLAREVDSPNTTSLTLLHTLSMMRREQALAFRNIARFALMDITGDFSHLLLFVSSNREAYEKENITPTILKDIERLGLIECNFTEEYVFRRKKVFRTGNKAVTVYGDSHNQHKIKAGNVKFTKDGQLLYSVLDSDSRRYRSDILDFTITRFKNRNCQVVINEREIK